MQTYGWQEVPNRVSVQVGNDPTTTTVFDDANRPTSDSSGSTYQNDEEGRLTAKPGQTLLWDSLGRLTQVRTSPGGAILATYSYDALDRLLKVERQGTTLRFRYVGLSTLVAQTVNDTTEAVILNVGNSWAGERLADWENGGLNQRFYGTNGHADVTWTSGLDGSVIATLRYDPWGNTIGSTGSLPEWRFQGSWYDTSASLSWALTRWYSPPLGAFISEDDVLGSPSEPPSRHLYAYGIGDPINNLDQTGTHYLRVSADTTWSSIASRYYGSSTYARALARVNFTTIYNTVRKGTRYWLGNHLYNGYSYRNHTVYRRDDPINKHDGYAFGTPYHGNPLVDGYKAWLPEVLSPPAPLSCTDPCAGVWHPRDEYVAAPPSSGTWIDLRGWRASFVDTGDAYYGGWIHHPRFATQVNAVKRRYPHGAMWTLWLNYDATRFACSSASELCPKYLKTAFTLKSGTTATGVDPRLTSVSLYAWEEGLGWEPKESYALSSPPRNYGHVNMWVPRAWGGGSSVRATRNMRLGKGNINFDHTIPTGSKTDYYERRDDFQ